MSYSANEVFCRRVGAMLIALGATLFSLRAAAEEGGPPIVFRHIITSRPRHITVSDDGRYLLVSTGNRVVVWDIAGGSEAGEVTVQQPVGAVLRAGKLIVASATGAVVVFDAKDFSPSHHVETPAAEVFNLSAPRGEAFDGRVFLGTREGPCLVDIGNKAAVMLGKPPRVKYSWEKTLLLARPDGKSLHYGDQLYRLTKQEDEWRMVRFGRLPAPVVEAYHDSPISLSSPAIHEWNVPEPIAERPGAILVPDATQPVFYAIDKTAMECRLLNRQMTLVGSRPVTDEGEWQHTPTTTRLRANPGPDYAVATTIGENLYVFARGAYGVWCGHTSAFDIDAAAAEVPAEPVHGAFEPVAIEGPVRWVEMSEDGKHLFLSVSDFDKVAVLDTRSGEEVASLPCKAPRALLCRGSRLFVGSSQEGGVSVFSLDEWKMVDHLAAGKEPAGWISAPGGKYFDGRLLVSAGQDNYLVDVAADRAQLLEQKGQCAWSYVGNLVRVGYMDQPAKVVLTRLRGDPVPAGEPQGTASVWLERAQYHEQDQWIRHRQPRPSDSKEWVCSVQDVVFPVQHVLYERELITRRLADGVLCSSSRSVNKLFPWTGGAHRGAVDTALAATLDGITYVYVAVRPDGQLYRLTVPATGVDETAAAVADPDAPSTDGVKIRSVPKEHPPTWTLNRQHLLMPVGMELWAVDAAATTLVRRYYLERAYETVWQRPGGGLARLGSKLYLLDRTLKETKEFDIQDRYATIAPNPTQPFTYVRVAVHEDGRRQYRLHVLNETSGELHARPDARAEVIAADPRGQFLFAAFDNSETEGHVIDRWGGVWEVRRARYVLVAYTAKGISLRPHKAVEINRMPSGILVSGDGERLALEVSADEGIFTDRNLKVLGTTGRGRLVDMHPSLPWALTRFSYGSPWRVIDVHGTDLTERLPGELEKNHNLHCFGFCPNGRHVITAGSEETLGENWLRALPLHLSAEEQPAVARAIQSPGNTPATTGAERVPSRGKASGSRDAAQAPGVSRTIAREQLDSLRMPQPEAALTSREVGRLRMDSVVVIRAGDSGGTGFVVGGDGYIVTCAHVLGGREKVTVGYRTGGGELAWAAGQLIARDAANDLALVKLSVPARLPPVPLAAQPPAVGENVTVIGHPGLGAQSLEYTLTAGIVSRAEHRIDGLPFIQTTATINPGNSGGPMFDEKGCLAGAVVLKDLSAEKRSFAIGASRIRAFLERCAAGADAATHSDSKTHVTK